MKLFLSAALVPLSAIGVLSKDTVPKNGLMDALNAAKAKLAGLSGYSDTDGNNGPSRSPSAFGTRLFSEVCDVFPSENVLISPLSVHKALTLVKDGATAGSQNEAELQQLLDPPSMIEQTDDDPDVELSIATSVWADQLKTSYVEEVTKDDSTAAFPLPRRYTPIDDWIFNNTNGMIDGFMGDDPVPQDIVALLVNAVYFKGAWTYEFDPNDTVDGEFSLRDGSTLPARFMAATRAMGFAGDLDELGGASAVVLDYGKKTSDEPTEFTSMFILPAEPGTDSMDSVIEGMISLPLPDLLSNAREKKVDLKLPRFRLNQPKVSLTTPLENMGMNIAFNDEVAEKFDRMSYDPTLTVDDVFHGAVMEVTESGTEAAAATVIPMRSRSRPRPPPEMIFNRPFVVAIIHRRTGEPVFIGRVEKPVLDFD